MFGQDYYEADPINLSKPDIDIQLYTPWGGFTSSEINSIQKAIRNWENLITNDKDSSGLMKLAFTKTSSRMSGSPWSWVWGETYLEDSVGYRYDLDISQVDIGNDYHNRVNLNSSIIGGLSTNKLIRLTMHEIGHTLGLNEAQDDTTLGLDSVMDKYGLDAKITEGMFKRLESLGYKVNRSAVNSLVWS